MSKQKYDNSGAIYKNDRREKDTHPHMTGSATIDGVEYWVSAWTKEGTEGRARWQSLAFKKKNEDGKHQGGQNEEPRSKAATVSGDDIPF